ncbi:MAG TPA: nuclear transport factor 2 family protein [Frankiaceae bacterium]|nr:nuclear transport factor 2 family protein [Frankiaceae bacterium]
MQERAEQEWNRWRGPIPSPSPAELADRYAASQLVKVYALGVDMRDLETVLSVFTPDAMVEGMAGSMPASEYLPNIFAGASVYSATQHNITNQHVWIDPIDSGQALVWSYAVCYHLEEPGSGRDDLIVATQYRDRCRRFEGGWLITARTSVPQWIRGPYPRSES